MKSILYHIKAGFEVANQLAKGRFWIYFLPGILVSFVYWWISSWATGVDASDGWLSKIPWIGSYLVAGAETAFSVMGFLIDQVYVFIVLTVLSPFNTILSEKLDNKLIGGEFEGGFIRLINDLIRMIFIVILALILEFFFIGFWWLITWLIGFSGTAIYIVGSFLIASFFFGFSFYDHSLERYSKGVFGSLGFAFSNGLMVTLTGAIFHLIYMIPHLGIVLSPVLTTMIATIVYLYHLGELPKSKSPIKENE